jgi:cyclic nucleotide gated channel, plant
MLCGTPFSLSLSLYLNSCYGQSLLVSTYLGETLYAIFVAVVGLVLFAHLIGNVQVLLSSLLLITHAN